MNNMIYIHDIKLEGNSEFAERFNDISDYWEKANDPTLTEEKRKEYLDIWFIKRQCLELGIG